MARIPETEIMNNPESVNAYTMMTASGGLTGNALSKLKKSEDNLNIADIGCGPCGYYNELLPLFPNSIFTGYEASNLMIEKANLVINKQKVNLVNSFIPDSSLPSKFYDIIFSALFLHQLPDQAPCWQTIKQIGKEGSKFYVFDLLRVEDSNLCWDIVNGMTPQAPDVFKNDFYNTLRASFTVEEIKQQLLDAGLTATIETEEIYTNCKVVYVIGTL